MELSASINDEPSGDPVHDQAKMGRDGLDQERRRLFWTMPSGLYLLGSFAGGVRNLMTLNWASQVASEPKLLGVSVENGALTHRLVETSGLFTLSVLAREDRAVVRKFVKPAVDDRSAMTLNGIGYIDAAVTGLPVFAEALGYFECRVHDSKRFPSHTLFVGEVIDVFIGPAIAGGTDVAVLEMDDTRMNYGG